ADAEEPFTVLRPREVDLDDEAFAVMAGIYDITELATAVKPWLLRRLLADTGGPVLYLDPDIEVYGPLHDLAAAAAEHQIAVMPHVLTPIPNDGKRPSSTDILAAGIYNLGFLGVGSGSVPSGFFDFWCERLWRYAIVDPAAMLFTDQRWMDFVDCFAHIVIRDPTCNLAYWNAWAYDITEEGDVLLVDGQPVRFFHFSGFDPRQPHRLSRHQGPAPRVVLSEHPALAARCRGYAARVMAEGDEELSRTPYGWGRCHGIALDGPPRRLYRAAVIAAEKAGQPRPPGPFTDPAAFLGWVSEPVVEDGPPRIVLHVHAARPDLQAAFPDPHGADANALTRWAADDAGMGQVLAPRLLPRPTGTRPGGSRPGLNLTGYLTAEAGVGEAGRLVAEAAAAVGLPHALRVTTATTSPVTHPLLPAGSAGSPYDVNLLCVNADRTAETCAELGSEALAGRATAGLWFWESPRLPERMRHAFALVDEVWAASDFTRRALARDAPGPVRLLHLPIRVPSQRPRATRADLGLPPGFLVLVMLSLHSITERKNPLGAIEAYRRAFATDEGARLVVKTVGGETHGADLGRLRGASEGRSDITVVDRSLRPSAARAMIAHCDCLLSLHRSEGFGLIMAEAMARARPVVATGWSGNLDFMDGTVAHLVPHDLVTIPVDCDPYAGTGLWAEPDLDAAAEALRRVHDDPAGTAALGERARRHIVATRSHEQAGRRLAHLVASLRGDRALVGSPG
ncbi:MAG: glycosyltransferase family 4 protein, partial [Acidimicrobiales bacterium]